MIKEGVTHTCKFANIIISEFMNHDWENKMYCNIQKLWNGDFLEYQLGKASLTALNQGRNAMSCRIVHTIGECMTFIHINNDNISF